MYHSSKLLPLSPQFVVQLLIQFLSRGMWGERHEALPRAIYLSCSVKSLEFHLVQHLAANKTSFVHHKTPSFWCLNMVFKTICYVLCDLDEVFLGVLVCWSWLSLSTTRAQTFVTALLDSHGQQEKTSQHKICLGRLVWGHTESGLGTRSSVLSALGFLCALVSNKSFMETSCFVCSPERRWCVAKSDFVCKYDCDGLV